MNTQSLAITALLATALLAGYAHVGQAPISDRYGLCIDLPRVAGGIRLYAPVDTIYAVLQERGRALVRFRIDTMPGEELCAAEQQAEASPGWSSGAFTFFGPISRREDLIIVKNYRSDLHGNLFITVSRATSLPSWINVPSLERSISHCGENGRAEWSTPPKPGDPMDWERPVPPGR